MPTYKKRTESTLVAQVMRCLAIHEGMGNITWFTRLQSGAVRVVKGWKGKTHQHHMQLCRKGTPDIMVMMRSGEILWLELKTLAGKVRPDQRVFEQMVEPFANHYHLILRDVQTLDNFIRGEE